MLTTYSYCVYSIKKKITNELNNKLIIFIIIVVIIIYEYEIRYMQIADWRL